MTAPKPTLWMKNAPMLANQYSETIMYMIGTNGGEITIQISATTAKTWKAV